jgi:hypothetical protein
MIEIELKNLLARKERQFPNSRTAVECHWIVPRGDKTHLAVPRELTILRNSPASWLNNRAEASTVSLVTSSK